MGKLSVNFKNRPAGDPLEVQGPSATRRYLTYNKTVRDIEGEDITLGLPVAKPWVPKDPAEDPWGLYKWKSADSAPVDTENHDE